MWNSLDAGRNLLSDGKAIKEEMINRILPDLRKQIRKVSFMYFWKWLKDSILNCFQHSLTRNHTDNGMRMSDIHILP